MLGAWPGGPHGNPSGPGARPGRLKLPCRPLGPFLPTPRLSALAELRVQALPGGKGLLQPFKTLSCGERDRAFQPFPSVPLGAVTHVHPVLWPPPPAGLSRCPKRPRWALNTRTRPGSRLRRAPGASWAVACGSPVLSKTEEPPLWACSARPVRSGVPTFGHCKQSYARGCNQPFLIAKKVTS